MEPSLSPDASGLENARALQQAVDQRGTVTVARPGVYRIAATVYVPGQTTIEFGAGVFLQKVDEQGPFSHVLLNKGARTRACDEHITIRGLQLIVNGIDHNDWQIYGLRGQIAFFHVKDLRIEGFRCLDLGKQQFAIHVCTFEELHISDVIIKGKKDGIHLGRGRRFTIRDGVFQTFDDAIALNAHDYATSNPELGWIEHGLIENCHDLDAESTTGYFCRILAGAWSEWRAGMEVQQSDTVVSNGRLYRVQAQPDGTTYVSLTQPTHASGSAQWDGINWGVVQNDPVQTAGVRHVTFRSIFLHKARTAFSIHFDNDRYSRSFYPASPMVQQQQLRWEDVRVLHEAATPLLAINTPVDVLSVANSSLRDNPIVFRGNGAMEDYLPTTVQLVGCVFEKPSPMRLLINEVPGKRIALQTHASAFHPDLTPLIENVGGDIRITSDLPL